MNDMTGLDMPIVFICLICIILCFILYPAKYKIGSFVDVKILDINAKKSKIILSVNHASYDKEQTTLLKYAPKARQTLSLAIQDVATN